MAELVIAEGVELELRAARIAGRFAALLLDGLIQGVLFLILLFVTLKLTGGSGTSDSKYALTVVVVVLVTLGYPVLCETVTAGRSPGKMAAGLRVVRLDGGPERFRHALARALAGLFADLNLPLLAMVLLGGQGPLWICLVGFPGAAASTLSRDGQRIGDLLAGTIVVRDRVATGHGSLPLPPGPALSAWAAGASVGQVPAGLVVAARQLISRVGELDRVAAAWLAEELAGEITAHVSPPPPAGTPAYQYLVAVAGERFRREAGYGAGFGAGFRQPPALRGRRH